MGEDSKYLFRANNISKTFGAVHAPRKIPPVRNKINRLVKRGLQLSDRFAYLVQMLVSKHFVGGHIGVAPTEMRSRRQRLSRPGRTGNGAYLYLIPQQTGLCQRYDT